MFNQKMKIAILKQHCLSLFHYQFVTWLFLFSGFLFCTWNMFYIVTDGYSCLSKSFSVVFSFYLPFPGIGVVIFEHILWLDVQTEFKSNNYIFKLMSEVIADISMYSAVVSVPALSATVFVFLWRVSYFLSIVFTSETS